MHFFAKLFDFIIINCYLCAKFPNMKEKTAERIPASKLLEKNVKALVQKNNFYATGCRSQAQLAKAIGITAPSLNHALKGNPSLSTIQKIADTLGVSVASLFYDEWQIQGYVSIQGRIKQFHSEEELNGIIAEGKTPLVTTKRK